jgi:hypothetical protein
MAAGPTYVPIETRTLASTTASVTFSSIPQTYTNLILIVNALNDAGYRALRLELNGDGSSNYSTTHLTGDTATANSGRSTNTSSFDLYSTIAQTDRGVQIINLLNYSNTTTYKTVITRSANAINARASAGLWRSTAAINSIKLELSIDNFASNSVFTLYGIAAA